MRKVHSACSVTGAWGLMAALAACSHPSIPVDAPAITAQQPLAVTKTVYDVTFKLQTKIVDADTMTRAYRGTAADGTLRFDAGAAPSVGSLTPGSVVVFSHVALLKVTGVESSGGIVAISGTPAGLEDAIENGHIAWTAPLNFNKVVFNPPPGFHRLTAEPDHLLALENLLGTPVQADISLSTNTWSGKVKDWDTTISLTPSSGNLHLDLHATKTIAGGTIDLHGTGQFDGLTNQTSITLANGSTTEVTFDNKGLRGSIDFTWKLAFDADHGGAEPELRESDVEKLPFSLDFPIAVGPIPFVVSFKTGFAFEPFFSSKVAVAQGSYHASYGGDVPMTDTADGSTAGSAPAAADSAPPPAADGTTGTATGDGSIDSYGGTLSLAAIGLSATVALPRIGLTIGLPSGLDAILQSPDFGGPWVTMVTQADFIATGTLSMVQCEKRSLKVLVVTGYTPGLLGKLKMKPQSKTVLTRNFSQIEPPNITLCNH